MTTTARQQNSYSNSFVYRIDVAKLEIDGVVPVGKVPKYVAVTPDGKYVLDHELVQLRPEHLRRRDRPGGQAASRWARTRAASS